MQDVKAAFMLLVESLTVFNVSTAQTDKQFFLFMNGAIRQNEKKSTAGTKLLHSLGYVCIIVIPILMDKIHEFTKHVQKQHDLINRSGLNRLLFIIYNYNLYSIQIAFQNKRCVR